MNDTMLRDKNQITLPTEVVQAAGLVPCKDRVAWRFEQGEIRGHKLSHPSPRAGRLGRDRRTGMLYWDGAISPEEAEEAALSANLDRE